MSTGQFAINARMHFRNVHRFPLNTGMQRVPVGDDGRRIKDLHTQNDAERELGLPRGYFEVLGGGLPHSELSGSREEQVRPRIFKDGVSVAQMGQLENFYSSDEMYEAAKYASEITEECITGEVSKLVSDSDEEDADENAFVRLQKLDPESRRKAWDVSRFNANEKHKRLGCRAMPIFHKLPYFRCDPWNHQDSTLKRRIG